MFYNHIGWCTGDGGPGVHERPIFTDPRVSSIVRRQTLWPDHSGRNDLPRATATGVERLR